MGVGKWLAIAGAVLCVGGGASVQAGEDWRSLETPDYSVLSQLSDRETRAWAAEFDVFIDSFKGVIGSRREDQPPLTVVLFAPQAGDGSACAVRHGTWGLSGLRHQGDDGAARRDALREGVRWLTGTADGKPRWLETGLAEVFSSFAVRAANVRWGEAMPDHLALLRERGLVPLEAFLDHPEAVIARDGDTRRYTAQAWALTHVLFFGGEPARRERFAAWLRHRGLQGGDAGFRAAFRPDFEAVQRDLASYLADAPAGSGITPRGMVERKYVMSAASRLQVDTALGLLEVAR